MSNYRRWFTPGGQYFFTLCTYKRQRFLTTPDSITRLRAAFAETIKKYPFTLDAIVILPDHLHCIWSLPTSDQNFPIRWSLIKRKFSSGLSAGLNKRREKKIWQKRYWEHLIRDEEDYSRCMEYIYYNPVKHGYVEKFHQWQHSSLKKHIQMGWFQNELKFVNVPELYKGMEME